MEASGHLQPLFKKKKKHPLSGLVWEHNDSNIILQTHRGKKHKCKGLTLILSVKKRDMNLEGNCYCQICDEDTCLSTKMPVNVLEENGELCGSIPVISFARVSCIVSTNSGLNQDDHDQE